MDYESTKAIILARLKKWQEGQETVKVPATDDRGNPNIGYPSIAGTQIASAFVHDILLDLRTAYDIQDAQQQWRPAHLPIGQQPQDLPPEEEKMLEEHRKGIKQSLIDVQVTDMLETGLTINGAHHKQYALWRIAEILNLTHFFSNIEDHGIAP